MLEIVQNKSDKGDKLVDMLERRQQQVSPRIEQQVRNIIRAVLKDGDKAVLHYTKEFDDVIHNTKSMCLSEANMKKAASKAKPELKKVFKKAIANIKAYHQKQKVSSWNMKAANGVTLGQKVCPLNRVGLYVPGGSGAYPSSILMNVVPALVAGVKEIVIVTPPFKSGVRPDIAAALLEVGVKEVYMIGGAQAVAALAYGTDTIRKVDKIVGPGNLFVSVAKKLVFGDVDIDMIAGPSEVVIIADDSADPAWIASDMLSQAEHGSGYEMAVCISTSPRIAIALHKELIQQVSKSPKKGLLEKALTTSGGLIVAENLQDAAELADRLAPEHLEIMTRQPQKIAKQIRNAGAVFLGQWTPEAVGDYIAGPSHVLPTGGSARFFSPLGVYDFVKKMSVIEYTQEALKKNSKDIMLLAETEGFVHHKDSVARRLAKK